jgi:hypothetical protein
MKNLHVECLDMRSDAGDWCLARIVARLGWSPKVSNTIVVASLSRCVRVGHARPASLKKEVLFQRTPKVDHQAPTLVGWESFVRLGLRWMVG